MRAKPLKTRVLKKDWVYRRDQQKQRKPVAWEHNISPQHLDRHVCESSWLSDDSRRGVWESGKLKETRNNNTHSGFMPGMFSTSRCLAVIAVKSSTSNTADRSKINQRFDAFITQLFSQMTSNGPCSVSYNDKISCHQVCLLDLSDTKQELQQRPPTENVVF